MKEHSSKRPSTQQTKSSSQKLLFDNTSEEPKADPCPRTFPPSEFASDLRALIGKGKCFTTIYADPPWQYDNSAARGAAAKHYQTMSIEQLHAEPVAKLAADNAHLHLWTTNAFLPESFGLMEAWGFQYKSCLIWVKPELGMGNYWRVSHEFLLLGVRGRLPFRDRCLQSWFIASRSKHSKKPESIRLLIEKASPGPYLELYGREWSPGSPWTV
jgi:N6-adenosine-specific RNA methylase IME4